MAQNVINLKNITRRFDKSSEEDHEEIPTFYSWKANDDIVNEKKMSWYIKLGFFALALIVFAIFAHSYFFVALIIFSYIAIILSAARQPHVIDCKIDENGITLGKFFFQIKDITSFYIFKTESETELSLKTDKILRRFIRVPIEKDGEKVIRAIIAEKIPEEEHPLFLTDQIAKHLFS